MILSSVVCVYLFVRERMRDMHIGVYVLCHHCLMSRLKGSNEDSITVAWCLQPLAAQALTLEHKHTNLYTVTRFPSHTSYNAHTLLTQMKFECPQHTDKGTHTLTTHSITKPFENPEGAISKSAKEKRMITLPRVHLRAFCDYGYLFGAAQYSQTQNERKYWSLLGYENTRRPQIISCNLSPQSPFLGSISASSMFLHQLFSFTSVTTAEVCTKQKKQTSVFWDLAVSLSFASFPQKRIQSVKHLQDIMAREPLWVLPFTWWQLSEFLYS